MIRLRRVVLVVLLLAIAVAGIYLSAPAIVALAVRWDVPSIGYRGPVAIIVILEASVAVGTLLWLDSALAVSQRVAGAVFVLGALLVTLTAGIQAYGPMGLIAPISYGMAAHVTALALGGRAPGSGTDGASRWSLRWERFSWARSTEDGAHESRDQPVAVREAPVVAAAPVAIEHAPESATTATATDGDDLADRIRALRDEDGRLPSKRRARDELRVGWPTMAPVYDQVAAEVVPTGNR